MQEAETTGKHVLPHLSVYKNVNLYSFAKKKQVIPTACACVRCLYDVSIEIISSSEINHKQVLCAPPLKPSS